MCPSAGIRTRGSRAQCAVCPLGRYFNQEAPGSRSTIQIKNETRKNADFVFLSMGYEKDIFTVFAYEFELLHK